MTTAYTKTFEYKDDKSSKFWDVTQAGSTVTVRYGKTGANGQTQEKVFNDAEAATQHVERLIAEKTGKGYVQVGGASSTSAETAMPSGVAAEQAVDPAPKANTKKSPAAERAKPKSPAQNSDATPDSLMALHGKDDATNRLLAKHPRASGELLEKLSHSSDKATRQAVAANPNTAPETLVRLGQQFPKEFLANPALDLLLMINPALMEEVPDAFLIRVLKQSDCPASLLTWAAGHSEAKVQLAVAMNANVPEQARQKLASSKHQAIGVALRTSTDALEANNPEVAFEAAVRERLGSVDLAVLQEAWANGDIGLAQWSALPISFRLVIATNGKVFKLLSESRLPHAVSEKFASDAHSGVRSLIAENPWTPPHVLEKLANDEFYDVRWNVAKNPNIPAHVKERLAKGTFLTRSHVAKNPNSSSLVLEELARDLNSNIRVAVAENPSTPMYVIGLLANDKNSHVRNAIARSEICPAYVLEALAKDRDIFVKLSVARNPSTPVGVLEDFWRSGEKWVVLELAQNSSTPASVLEALAKKSTSVGRCEIAKNPNTPVHVLEALAKQKNMSVSIRVALASNCHRSEALFEQLRSDPNIDVRSAVRCCKGLTAEALEALLQEACDEGDWVDLLLNPGLNSKSAAALMECLFDAPAAESPWYRRAQSNTDANSQAMIGVGSVFSYSGKDPNAAVLSKRIFAPLLALCSGPFIETSRIVKVAGSTDWLIRAAVARNPGTPPSILKKLCADAHYLVASLALKSLKKKEAPTEVQSNEVGPELISNRVIKEVVVRLRHEDLIKIFKVVFPFFCDDVWCDYVPARHIAWMTAIVIATRKKVTWINLPCSAFESRLGSAAVGKMIELAVMFELGCDKAFTEVRLWAAENPSCLDNVLKMLANDENPKIVLAALRNGGLSSEDAEAVRQKLMKLRGKNLLALLSSDLVFPEMLAEKSKSSDRHVLLAIAGNPNTPAAILAGLSSSSDESILCKLAGNPSVPADVLSRLSKHKDYDVRWSVAENPATSIRFLEILARDKEPSVRRRVAENSAAPSLILDLLARDADAGVRKCVASSANASAHALDLFLYDNDRGGLSQLAQSSNLSLAAFEALCASTDVWVLRSLASNPRAPISVLEKLAKNPTLLRHVVANPSAPASLLDACATDVDVNVRGAVARNSTASPSTLEVLSRDADVSVRRAVAMNPSVPQSVLARMAHDGPFEIEVAVAMNPTAPLQLYNPAIDKWVDRLQRAMQFEQRQAVGQSVGDRARIGAADLLRGLDLLGLTCLTNDNKDLTKLSRSRDWLTRLGVALHPSVTEGILKVLRQDSDPDVARVAAVARTAIHPSSVGAPAKQSIA